MSDNPLDRIPSFDRVSVRAVVVYDDEDPTQVLSEAGIFDPIVLPAMFGEDQPDFSIGDGITPNLVAVLETEQAEEVPFDAPSRADRPQSLYNGSQRPAETSQAQPLTASLPAAYGIQPLAPVRPRAVVPAVQATSSDGGDGDDGSSNEGSENSVPPPGPFR